MDAGSDVFTLPPYLLKTPFGESLQKQLTQPSPTTQELSRSTRLSATGVLGTLPSRFNDPSYHDQVLSMITHSPHISSTASRRPQLDDADHDSSMMDASRVQTNDFTADDDIDNLESIHYGGNSLLDDDEEEEDDGAMQSDHEEDDMGTDFPGTAMGLRPMAGRRRSSAASRGQGSRGATAPSEAPVLGGFRYPLPEKWVPNTSTQLNVSDAGLTLKVEQVRATNTSGSSISKNYDYQCAKANAEIPVNTGVFYFETKILTATNNNNKGLSDVVIGFMHSGLNSVPKMPGLEMGSYGLNGRDGTTTANQTISRRYNREFGQGDVIGCGVNFATKSIFYTKNGIYLGIAFKDISKALVPSIGLKSGNSVTTNFGMSSFRFDIEGYIEQEKLKISQKVLEHTSTGHTAASASNNACNDMEMRVNSYTDKEIPTLMQKLVSSYFDHLGYVDISKTFSEEVKKERFQGGSSVGTGKEGVDTDSEMRDEDDGTSISVEEANLKTRQQIRKYLLDGEIDGAIKLTTVHFPNVFEKHGEILFKLSCTKFLQLIKQSKIDEALIYGQSLGEEYSANQKYVDTLNDIFTLLAYEDPENESEFGYLLKEDEVLKISDELNAEILKSLGQSSISDLERLMRHTKAMLKIMNCEKAQLDTLLMTNDDYGL